MHWNAVCLKEKLSVVDNVLEEDINVKPNIIPVQDVIMGPLNCSPAGRRKWEVQNYENIKKFFNQCQKYDRVKCHDNFVCEKMGEIYE